MKVWFGALGGLLGLVASGLIKDTVGFTRDGTLGRDAGARPSGTPGRLGIWNHASRTTPPVDLPLKGAILQTFKNRSFQQFLPSFVLFQLAYGLMLGMLPFFVKAILDVDQEGTWIAGPDGGRDRGRGRLRPLVPASCPANVEARRLPPGHAGGRGHLSVHGARRKPAGHLSHGRDRRPDGLRRVRDLRRLPVPGRR